MITNKVSTANRLLLLSLINPIVSSINHDFDCFFLFFLDIANHGDVLALEYRTERGCFGSKTDVKYGM